MLEWINSLPPSTAVLYLFSVVFALLFLLGGILLLCHITGVAKLSKDGVEWNGFKRKKKSPHSACLHGKDIVILLTKQQEMLDEVHRLEKQVLKDQLSYVKASAVKLRGRAQAVFLTLLRTTLKTEDKAGLVMHDDYREYVRALKDAYDMCFDVIEPEFETTDFAKKYPKDKAQEFMEYEAGKTAELFQGITDFLNESYHGKTVGREAVFDENTRIKEEIQTVISKCFWNARDVALDFAQHEKELRSAFNRLMNDTIM